MVAVTGLSRERVLLHQKVEVARTQLARAHSDLDKVLAEVRSLPAALKTSVVDSIESAFDTLKEAERYVAEVDEIVLLDRDSTPAAEAPAIALALSRKTGLRSGDHDGLLMFFGLTLVLLLAHAVLG